MAMNLKKQSMVPCIALVLLALSVLLASASASSAHSTNETQQPQLIYESFMPVVVQQYPYECTEGIGNGSFETDSDWIIPITKYTASYSDVVVRTGDRSLHAGIDATGDNVFSYSSARQIVTIPDGIDNATLGFWLYTATSEPTNSSLPENPLSIDEKEAQESGDAQLVLILDSNGQELERLINERQNYQSWMFHTFDLTKYAGQTIQIYFGVYNNGVDGVTSMFVEDVSLTACHVPAPEPVCWQGIDNTSFEDEKAWIVPTTRYPAAYSSDQAKSGTQSMRSGIINPGDNRFAYSSAYQTVSIPAGASDATLNFWLYPMSSEPTYLRLPTDIRNLREATAAGWGDVQLVILYDTSWKELERLVHMRRYDEEWLEYRFDLSEYADETITIYFDVINNGHYGVTSMYIDDVSLESCAVAP